MLKIRIENAQQNIPIINNKRLSAIPIILRETASKTNETINGYLLSKRETNQPETGSPIKELTGITISRFPNSASFKSKAILIVGIREAQVEKQKPERKK